MNTDMQLDIYHYLVHECRLDPDEAWCTISDIEADIDNGLITLDELEELALEDIV